VATPGRSPLGRGQRAPVWVSASLEPARKGQARIKLAGDGSPRGSWLHKIRIPTNIRTARTRVMRKMRRSAPTSRPSPKPSPFKTPYALPAAWWSADGDGTTLSSYPRERVRDCSRSRRPDDHERSPDEARAPADVAPSAGRSRIRPTMVVPLPLADRISSAPPSASTRSRDVLLHAGTHDRSLDPSCRGQRESFLDRRSDHRASSTAPGDRASHTLPNRRERAGSALAARNASKETHATPIHRP
jgi:hypothetical protein